MDPEALQTFCSRVAGITVVAGAGNGNAGDGKGSGAPGANQNSGQQGGNGANTVVIPTNWKEALPVEYPRRCDDQIDGRFANDGKNFDQRAENDWR